MTLKKPSDLFRKKSSYITEDYSPIVVGESVGLTETFDRFKNNLEKIDELSNQVESLTEEISSKLTKKDLENAMISHLMVVNENFKLIQQQVKGLNKSDLNEFHKSLNEVVSIVNNLVTKEIPNYKKKIINSEFNIGSKFETFKDSVNNKIEDYHLVINELKQTLDKSYELRNEINLELEDIRQYKETVDKYTDKFVELTEDIDAKLIDFKTDVVINENHLKKVENFILKNHNHIVELKKEVFSEISRLSLDDINENIDRIEGKIKYIEQVYDSINAENLINESLLAEPPETDNEDPLTPLNKKFVTQQDLQNHYRLFLNRVQQQLATIGGGGETQLKYLDDVVGIATNPAQYDGKFLKYDHTLRKFVFDDSSSITVSDTIPTDPVQGDLWYDSTLGRTFIYYVDPDGAQWVDASPSSGYQTPSYWIPTNVGIHTLSNVGVGTDNPTSKLTVQGTTLVTGISTFNSDINVGINTSTGVILTSPNGTKFRLIVDDLGALSTVIVP